MHFFEFYNALVSIKNKGVFLKKKHPASAGCFFYLFARNNRLFDHYYSTMEVNS